MSASAGKPEAAHRVRKGLYTFGAGRNKTPYRRSMASHPQSRDAGSNLCALRSLAFFAVKGSYRKEHKESAKIVKKLRV
jgi:hypothetical protein